MHVKIVVMLRNQGDTVNFWGREITKTGRGFEERNSTELVDSLLSLSALENSKLPATPERRSAAMELAFATP